MPLPLRPYQTAIIFVIVMLGFVLLVQTLISDPGSPLFLVYLFLILGPLLGAGAISQLTTSYKECSVCGHKIGSGSFFYSKLQSPQPYFHEHCYRETLRGQRKRCLNCNVPLYNPKSREFAVPVVMDERKQLFCSSKCSETYQPFAGLAVNLPTEFSCPYCKSVYSASLTKCPSCGAARTKAPLEFMTLNPYHFEQKVAELLIRMGYSNVTRVGGAGDRAVDITAQRKDEFGQVLRYAVQCKRYDASSHVGSSEMQVFCSMISRVHGSDNHIFIHKGSC